MQLYTIDTQTNLGSHSGHVLQAGISITCSSVVMYLFLVLE